MKTFILISTIVFTVAGAMAQTANGFSSRQYDTGSVTTSAGQTARLNVLYPTIPAPVLQVQCSASLLIADESGNVLKNQNVPQLLAGRSVSMDLNVDTDMPAGSSPGPLHAYVVTPAIGSTGGACTLVPTLELRDNLTGKTILVVKGQLTWPAAETATSAARVPPQ